MHEEAQSLNEPAQDKMVTAQQIEGHLWPERERIELSIVENLKNAYLWIVH